MCCFNGVKSRTNRSIDKLSSVEVMSNADTHVLVSFLCDSRIDSVTSEAVRGLIIRIRLLIVQMMLLSCLGCSG